MKASLTLQLDKQLIRRARQYAARSGKSLSEVVADFFERLVAEPSKPAAKLSPEVQSLVGALKPAIGTEAEYRRSLERKHR